VKLPLGSEPIRTLLIPLALAAFVAAAQAFMAGADTRAIITAALGVLIVGAQEYGRSLVTPVPKPTGEDGYSAIELLVGLIVFLVLVAVLVWVLRLLFGAL
jgi:hypothetical protein